MQSTHDETITVGALSVRFLVEAGESNGSVTVFECDVPAQSRMPAPHSHDAFEETIYGLHGVSTWIVDGEEIEIGPGQAVCIPRGSVHGFANHGRVDAKFLAVATPGVFGAAYFREIGDVLAAASPPDQGALAEVMRRHGLTPAPPAAPDAPTDTRGRRPSRETRRDGGTERGPTVGCVAFQRPALTRG